VQEIAVLYADEWSMLFRNDWEGRQEAARSKLLELIGAADSHLDVAAALAAADLAEFEADIARFEQYAAGNFSPQLTTAVSISAVFDGASNSSSSSVA
jgi:hypothetical protein